MKRRAQSELSPRPWKRRRVGPYDGDSVWDIILVLKAMDAGKDAEEEEQELVFLNASADAVVAFDWSGVVGNVDAFAEPDEEFPGDKDLLVRVPGAAQYVPIPNYLMLKQILRYLRLKALGFGIVFEPRNVHRGWLEMEIPCSTMPLGKDRKKFYSDEEFSKRSAMEGVCGEAISYLQLFCSVYIKDANFEQLGIEKKKASVAKTWCDLLNHAAAAKEKDQVALREAYACLFREAKMVCTYFSDVFPGGAIGSGSSSAAGEEASRIYYGGPRPPVSRADQFAFALIDVINRGANIGLPFSKANIS